MRIQGFPLEITAGPSPRGVYSEILVVILHRQHSSAEPMDKFQLKFEKYPCI